MKSHFKDQLVSAYDADAVRRADSTYNPEDWKLAVREKFARLAKKEGAETLLEFGAGVGFDAAYFRDQGFNVLATDLSSKMVEQCRDRGLNARVADVYGLLDLGSTFDAIYSMNVLLHVPQHDLDQVLRNIADALNAGGIFFLGVYGGFQREEVTIDPNMMNMPRFFSFLTDDGLQKAVTPYFDVISFEVVEPHTFIVGGNEPGFHFQSLILRKK